MKKHITNASDDLSKLLKDPVQNRRNDIWLWLYFSHYRKHKLPPSSCNGSQMRDVIAKALRYDRGVVLNSLSAEKDVFLLPDAMLKWIKEDARQYIWLRPKIERLTGLKIPRSHTHLAGRDRLVAMIDLWRARNIAEKAKEIEDLHSEWKRHSAKDIEFEWFTDKKESIKRCVCAWGWLEKNYDFYPRIPPRPFEDYQDLLIFFDKERLSQMEVRLIVKSIKSRWSRQQFDERSSDKKQVNVLLPKAVIAQLDALKLKHGLKSAQIIEKLLRMETKQGLYLPSD